MFTGIRHTNRHPFFFCFLDEEWTRLLELSPLFQQLKGVELQLRGWASKAGLLAGELASKLERFEFFVSPTVCSSSHWDTFR